jgi:hypothetical protein
MQALNEALALLPATMDTPDARRMLWAIGYQESNMTARRQFGNGPARGLLQFEQGGGVYGVMRHTASRDFAKHVADARGVKWSAAEIWRALETDDVLAFAFGRLLLWTDPRTLPHANEETAAWDYYYRNWRPGQPHRNKWSGNWKRALLQVPA